MWTRAELKSRARTALKPYYWWGVLACFIAGIFGSGGSNMGVSIAADIYGNVVNGLFMAVAGGLNGRSYSIVAAIVTMIITLFITIISLIFVIFVGAVVQIGKLNFFLESRYQNQPANISSLFWGFSGGRYLNIVKVMFFKLLYEFLWGLLLIVPGIIKHYEFYMVPYLLADEPGLDKDEALRLSKQMMDGNKFKTFVLELSFIGWMLLGFLACCLGVLFVQPYYEAVFAELYFELKQNTFSSSGQETVYMV